MVGERDLRHALSFAWHRRLAARLGPTPTPAGDLLDRTFSAPASDLVWVADITAFACLDGKLFLAGIKDLHDQGLAGSSMGERQTTDLVVNVLVMALARLHPSGELIHHGGRGAQHTAVEFSNRLADWGQRVSYSSTGGVDDNAVMESTWAALKREIRHRHGDSTHVTRSELRTILFDYIETFYNRSRHQAGLDHRTPAETYAASRPA